jgi:antitoxin component YwqK of YwqJK toxin-antitoxin module
VEEALMYEETFALLKERFPDIALKVEALKEFSWKGIKRGEQGDVDLIHGDQLLHTADNIEAATRYWVSTLPFKEIDGLIVYGLGLGHLWEQVKEWLHSRPYRRLIFIEDDLEIIHHFLSSQRAKALLSDPQVLIYEVPENLSDSESLMWKLAKILIYQKVGFTVLPSYEARKGARYGRIKFTYLHLRKNIELAYSEYLTLTEDFLKNFWKNLPKMCDASLLSALQGCFKGVPAIVCGAGPSLGKNIHLLKDLSDRALILSGGTAVNILNAHGLDPHLIVGLDPFETYFYRILSYTSFETPFVFKLRALHTALNLLPAPLIYLNGGVAYDIEKNLHEEMALPYLSMSLGTNVLNSSVSLAYALGCDPIITIGVDLAYSEGKSYGPGLKKHGMVFEDLRTKSPWEEVVVKSDIYGKPVYTVWKWINESVWYSEFQLSHPDVTLLNATEGGLGFQKVANVKLSECIDKHLTRSWDISGRLHAHLMEASMPETFSEKKLASWVQEILASLKRLLEKLNGIEKEDAKRIFRYEVTSDTELEPFKEEKAWQALVGEFDKVYRDYCQTLGELVEDQVYPVLEALGGHLGYLKKVILLNISLIEASQKDLRETEAMLPKVEVTRETVGDSNFYSKAGHLLASTTYLENKREGAARYYYSHGALFAALHFSQGCFEGIQKYYYPDGTLKSSLPYSNGLLDGEVALFWPSGRKHRISHFKKNQRHGFDRVWDEEGKLLISAEFDQDRPTGMAQMWSSSGILVKEIVYDDSGSPLSLREWDSSGLLIENPEQKSEDYLNFVRRNTQLLTKSFETVFSNLQGTLHAMVGKEVEVAEMASLKEEIEHLKELSQELGELSGSKAPVKEMEQNPEMDRQVKKELSHISEKMRGLIHDMNSQIKNIRKKIE